MADGSKGNSAAAGAILTLPARLVRASRGLDSAREGGRSAGLRSCNDAWEGQTQSGQTRAHVKGRPVKGKLAMIVLRTLDNLPVHGAGRP